MLSRFYVSNFKSFNKVTEFSMLSGGEKRHQEQLIKIIPSLKLLKKAVIYGANSSGKSNLVKAIDFSKDIIENGVNLNKDYSLEYFRNNINNEKEVSTFQYEIVIDKKIFLYGFDILLNKRKIKREWLYENKKSGSKLIFDRDNITKTFNSSGISVKNSQLKNKLSVYYDDILSDEENLFIKVINKKNDEIKKSLPLLIKIYKWFENIEIVYPDTIFTDMFNFFQRENNSTSIIKLLDYFDTGIKNYELIKSNIYEIESVMPSSIFEKFKAQIISSITEKEDDSKVKNNLKGIKLTVNSRKDLFEISFDRSNKKDEINFFNFEKDMIVKKLVFMHQDKNDNNNNIYYNFNEESDGTKRLIELLDIIINEKSEKVIIIDELDRSLHPMLTRKFIETYDKFSQNKNKQLIVTTHESSLLDQELLRRDSIWLVERNQNNESELLSLDSFSERYDKKLEKAYFEGRYGAVPVFKNLSFLDNEEGEKNCL